MDSKPDARSHWGTGEKGAQNPPGSGFLLPPANSTRVNRTIHDGCIGIRRSRDTTGIPGPPFYRKEFEDAYRLIIDDYQVTPKEIALFLPCAVKKPYSQSPSHRLFRRVIDDVLDPADYHIVIFGTCGTVPAELECMHPFRNYRYMLGKTVDWRVLRDFHRIEVYRLRGYLEKTRDTYRRRLAYCIGPFRAAMGEASEDAGIVVDLLPTDATIERLYDTKSPFPEGSLSMPAYIDEFREGLMRLSRSPAEIPGK